MKITDKIISIPPYISTSWDRVESLHMQEDILIISLNDNSRVKIPYLSKETIDLLFQTHATHLEHQAKPTKAVNVEQLINTPLKMVFGTIESIGQALQHNPAYSDLPAIPIEIANKLAGLGKVIPAEDIAAMPNPETGCNCMYCQMVRILKAGTKEQEVEGEKHEDIVSDEELRFEEWAVSSIGDKMYLVTNKLDSKEQYTVFLGDPIGCTCGKPHCEHVIAVLRH